VAKDADLTQDDHGNGDLVLAAGAQTVAPMHRTLDAIGDGYLVFGRTASDFRDITWWSVLSGQAHRRRCGSSRCGTRSLRGVAVTAGAAGRLRRSCARRTPPRHLALHAAKARRRTLCVLGQPYPSRQLAETVDCRAILERD
jgi:hypothetical protein